MECLWKFLSVLTVLVLLHLALMVYLVLHVSNTSMINSESAAIRIPKKDQDIPQSQGTLSNNIDVKKPNKRKKHLFLTHRIFHLSNISLHSNREIHSKARKEELIYRRSLKRKTKINRLYRNDPLEYKVTVKRETKNKILITTNMSLNHPITTKCKFSFEKKSVAEARKILSTSQSVYLFYINLLLKTNNSRSFDSTEKDTLFHWQYVLKKEKFLVQLPVDFDLFTFRLLYADREETVLNVNLLYTNPSCEKIENLTEETHSLRALLWNELFHNDTAFYLCNRNIQDKLSWRKLQYFITTIWVGYDLNCSVVSNEYGIHEVQLTKDDLPLVTPIFCYLLSLQFVWIFVLLDAYKLTRDDELTYYTENDRPYSVKRFFQKILYKKCHCIGCCCCYDKYKICNYRCASYPVRRLLFLTWLFILLPVGLYRTLGRFFILHKKMYHDYVTVIKPSESLFSLLRCDKQFILLFDTVYATILPFLFIEIGGKLYDNFVSEKLDDQVSEKEVKKGMNEETKPLINFAKQSDYESIPLEETPAEQIITLEETPAEQSIPTKETQYTNNRIIKKFAKPCQKMSQNLASLCCCCECENENDENEVNENKYDKNERIEEKPRIVYYCSFFWNGIKHIILFVWSLLCCLFPIIPYSFTSVFDKRKYCKSELLVVLFQFPIVYFFCLRPIISTFTFMFRAFTYYVFVALLIRTHIMQYTLLLVTTLVYFSKYLSEIINMNVEILKYMIDLQKSPEQSNKHNEEQTNKKTNEQNDRQKDNRNGNQSDRQSDKENAEANDKQTDKPKIFENIFTHIFKNLDFVRQKLYFLCLKTLVIFMYLFITIETFIRNKNSLNGDSVKSIIEFLLLIISPYAISFFLKTNKGDFLLDENKKEIEQKLANFTKENANQNKVKSVKNAGEHALVVQNL